MRVTVVGAGYVGCATAVALAHCGHQVVVLDVDPARIATLRQGRDPLGEPHLEPLLRAGAAVQATLNAQEAYQSPDAVVFAVGTPQRADGTAELEHLFDAARKCAKTSPPCAAIIRSTVPVGTADRLAHGILERFRVISNPEFLREGHAIADSLSPERIVAGGAPEDEALFRELYAPILTQSYQPAGGLASLGARPPLFWMSRRSAELTKYAANAFLATKLSFVNEIANLAASLGADIRAIAPALAADPRIGPSFLRPGIGWGGSCFPKDTRALAAFAAESGDELMVLRAAIEQNNAQLGRFMRLIRAELGGRTDIRIALLGLAFKEGTADTRESPAVALGREMLREGWHIRAYDPAVRVAPIDVELVESAIRAADGADAVVVATEWAEFGRADWPEIRSRMRGDLLFDGRCVVDPHVATLAGMRYRGICPPPPTL